MASELLLMSLLACQLSTFHKVAAKRGSTARARAIDGQLHFDEAGLVDRIEVAWDLQDVAGKEADTLLRLTDRVCTVSRALKVPVAARHNA